MPVFGQAHRGSTVGPLLLHRFSVGLAVEYSSCFISVLNMDLYVRCFDALMSRSPLRGPNNSYVYEQVERCGHVKPDYALQCFITDRSKAVLLLQFILIVIVCPLPVSL